MNSQSRVKLGVYKNEKISIIVAILVTGLSAEFVNPLGSAFKSTDNGGTLHAIDAYKDGIGVIVLDNQGTGFKIDNTPMNTLVYKYGETAKINNVKLDVAVLNDTAATNKDKEMAGSITNIVNGNVGSAPTKVDGETCSDGNPATVGETWLNGVCQGGLTLNITSNGLLYDNCEGGAIKWEDAKTYCESKGMRLPILTETELQGGTAISCPTGWTWTSTQLSSISYYVWNSGAGITTFYTSDAALVRCVK